MRRLAWVLGLLVLGLLCWSCMACESEIPDRGEMEAMRPPDGGKPRPAKTQKPLVPSLPPVVPEPDGGFPPIKEEPSKDLLSDSPPLAGMILLKWKMPDKSGKAYGIWLEPVLPSKDPLKNISAKDLLGGKKIPAKFAKRLHGLTLPTNPTYTTVLTPSWEKRILSRWIFNGVDNPNALPPKIGRTIKQITGRVELTAAFDLIGKIHTMLERKQQNLMAAAFALPARWLAEGDTWPLDIKPKIPQGFDHGEPQALSQARLVKLHTQQGEQLARVEMRVALHLEGIFLPGSSNPEKLSMDFVFVALGEFSLDRGEWRELKGYLRESSQGAIDFDDRRLFAVKALESVPDKAKILLKID